MIAIIYKDEKKVGEIFHKGERFSVKIIDETSREGSLLSNTIEYRKKNSEILFDTRSTPGSAINCRLGRSMVESFLILERGLPGFSIEIKKPLKKTSINEEGVFS